MGEPIGTSASWAVSLTLWALALGIPLGLALLSDRWSRKDKD